MKRLFLFLLFIMLLSGTIIYAINFSAIQTGQNSQIDTPRENYWPAESWRNSSPEEQGMDSEMLADLTDAIRESGKGVDSITIIRNGYLVNETFFYPYQKGLLHSLNSCTKSVISALTGIAINDGSIKSVNDRVVDYFPDMAIANNDEQKQSITIKDLMTMSSGIQWDFTDNKSTVEMQQSMDWTRFYLDRPMAEEPGSTFLYCNGASQTMASLLQKSTGTDPAKLFGQKLPIGIKDTFWAKSPEKVSSGYSGLYMHPDDMARFGYLYLRNGNWNGEQLIPAKWVEESTKPQIKANWGPLIPEYGYMWWNGRFGGYAALGYGGQYIFVLPELDMVVVFTSSLFQGNDFFYPIEWLEKYIIPSVISDKPLKENKAASEQLRQAVDKVQNAPPSQSAGALPEIAGRISGKTYKLDNSETLTIWFSGADECKVDLNSKRIVKMGLDNNFRVNDVGDMITGGYDHYHGAFKGRWLDEKTLQVDFRVLEEGFRTVYTIQFDEDRIEMRSKTNMDDTEVIVKGKY